MRHRLIPVAALALVAALAPPLGAQESLPVDPPVLGAEVARGTGSVVDVDGPAPTTARTLDARLDDWVGESSGFAGTAVHSAGELVYTDHLFDAYGADDGEDTRRRAVTAAAQETLPEAYRAEAGVKANLPGQAGAPPPPGLGAHASYGNLDYDGVHDIVEVRVAADADHLWVLVRTAQMHDDRLPGVLVLADTGEDAGEDVPFNAGVATERADVAVFAAGDRGWVADLAADAVSALPAGSVATNPSGFDNAVELRLPRALLDAPGLALTVATGPLDEAGEGFADTGLGANLANVAFRLDEPVREWFEERQALALHAGTVDGFLHDVDLARLDAGASEAFVAGPGYHERIFVSTTPGLAQEHGREGLFQHYGVYLPTAVADTDPAELPLTYWLHWRGGTAHVAAAVAPGIFRHQGEDRDGIVVSPRGRGTSTWYVGRGHADVVEVFADVAATFPHDPDRVYVSGHSMGGWGSYLLPILYPDRFAAAFPVAGPVTQGAWTGLDFPGCDDLSFDEYSPCYIEANDGRARDQHTRRMLDNLRHVPLAMFYAGQDELVPIAGAARQHERLLELGYTHRFYTFHGYEHYTHPVVDEWAEGVRYLDQFTRDPNPARVTYVRDAPFERAVNEVQSGGLAFDFAFDAAYWMSELTPADPESGRARFDGRTLARPEPARLAVPDAGGPTGLNQAGPFTFTGLRPVEDPLTAAPEAVNGFDVTLAGVEAVRLDMDRMDISTSDPVEVRVDTDHHVQLRLTGDWRAASGVTESGELVAAHHVSGDTLVIELPPGVHRFTLGEQCPPDMVCTQDANQ